MNKLELHFTKFSRRSVEQTLNYFYFRLSRDMLAKHYIAISWTVFTVALLKVTGDEDLSEWLFIEDWCEGPKLI